MPSCTIHVWPNAAAAGRTNEIAGKESEAANDWHTIAQTIEQYEQKLLELMDKWHFEAQQSTNEIMKMRQLLT